MCLLYRGFTSGAPFISAMLLAILLSGCFPMAAPERLPVFHSVEDATGRVEALDLDLSGKDFAGLPSGLDAIPGLKRLWLRENQLGSIGPEIAMLAHVPWIDMGRAGIQALPAQVEKLVALHSWWLSDNALTVLPSGITKLPALRYLNLDRNQLGVLPMDIGALSELRWLRLNGNQLTALPRSITSLASLERLYLANNKLTVLPEDIGQLKRLDTLVLTGNPLPEEEIERIRAALPACNVIFRLR